MKRLPATETVEEGSTVTFGCKIAGFPTPSITWYKENHVIEPDARAQVESDCSGAHSITIKDVSMCGGDTYKVYADNCEGSFPSSLYMYITVNGISSMQSCYVYVIYRDAPLSRVLTFWLSLKTSSLCIDHVLKYAIFNVHLCESVHLPNVCFYNVQRPYLQDLNPAMVVF